MSEHSRSLVSADLWSDLRSRHWLWMRCAMAMLALAIVCGVASLFDERTLYGVSVWSKPIKFSLSFVMYFVTLAWFAPLLGEGYFAKIRGRLLTALPIVCALGEMVYIVAMAARGEPSHFNLSTPFFATMYSLMGVGAVLLVTACLWMGLRIFWHSYLASATKDPYVLAVGIGLIMTFALGGGFGGVLSSSGGHWVGGVASDAGGLPLFHWARDGGDLRVAHFFGMHAMQVLPVAGALAIHLWEKSAATFAVVVFALAYAALSTATFVQALRGAPLF